MTSPSGERTTRVHTVPGIAFVENSARLAPVANLTAPERIILGGEGVRLVEVAAEAIQRGIAEDRDPRAHALELVTTPGDDTEWCRGAAVIAIQRYVLGRRL